MAQFVPGYVEEALVVRVLGDERRAELLRFGRRARPTGRDLVEDPVHRLPAPSGDVEDDQHAVVTLGLRPRDEPAVDRALVDAGHDVVHEGAGRSEVLHAEAAVRRLCAGRCPPAVGPAGVGQRDEVEERLPVGALPIKEVEVGRDLELLCHLARRESGRRGVRGRLSVPETRFAST